MAGSGAVAPPKAPPRLPKRTFRWLLVAAAFMSQFFTSGGMWAYGVYSAAYCRADALGTGGQQKLCALPGSLSVASWSLAGLVVGRVADDPRVGFRTTALFGALLWGLAYIIASFSTNLGLTVFAQGLLVGIGASANYFPTLALLPHFFGPRGDWRGAALGIAISGTGLGGFALAAGTEAMISAWGIPWALRATGLVGGACLVVTSMALPQISVRQIVTSKPFILSSLLIFFMPFGSMAPAYFGASFSIDVLGLAPGPAAFQVSILNIASTVGRVVQGLVAERMGGPATNLVVCVFLAGFLQMVGWVNVTSAAGMSAYMVAQGLAGGGYNGVLPATIASNFDLSVVATAMSMAYSFFTFGSLAGPVIQGALLDLYTTTAPDGTKVSVWYLPMIMFSGSVVIVASLFALWLRQDMSKGKWFVNV
ncbi:major facilitator superfamily domain-containing protein [Hyaloraphidium curvatum]|nr:major facilitator superfamily domain-containing protein [Hyaloraphidium curvatum]